MAGILLFEVDVRALYWHLESRDSDGDLSLTDTGKGKGKGMESLLYRNGIWIIHDGYGSVIRS